MSIILLFFFLFQTGDYSNLKDISYIGIGPTYYLDYSSDGLVEARGSQIWLNGTYWFTIKNISWLYSISLLSSDTLLYSAGKDGVGMYVDTSCVWHTLIDNGYAVVRYTDFNGSSMVSAFCGKDGIFLIDYYTGTVISNIEGSNSIKGLFLSDSLLLVVDSLSSVRIINIFSNDTITYDIKATDVFRDDSLLIFSLGGNGFSEYLWSMDSIFPVDTFPDIVSDHVIKVGEKYVIGSTINYKPRFYLLDSTFNVEDSLIYSNGAVMNMDISDDTLFVSLKNGGSIGVLVSDSLQLIKEFAGVNEIMYIKKDFAGRIWFTGGYANTILNCDINMDTFKIIPTSTPVVSMDIDSLYLYVAKSWGGIGIYEIEGDTLTEISSLSYSGRKCMDIKKKDNLCFIADAANGLVIVDVSDVYNPYIVYIDSLYPLTKIGFFNDTTLIGMNNGYILEYNIKDINLPVFIDSIYTGCVDFYIDNDTIYLALGYDGIGCCTLGDNLVFNTFDIDLTNYYVKSIYKSRWNELYIGTNTGMKVCMLDSLYVMGEYNINDYVWSFMFDSLWCIWGTRNSGLYKACTDVNSPFIVKTEPFPDTVINTVYTNLSLYVRDLQSGVDSVEVLMDGVPISGNLYDTLWVSDSLYFYEDTHFVTVYVQDRAYNGMEFSYYFICDTTPPDIKYVYPYNNSLLTDTIISLSVIVEDMSLNMGYAMVDNDTFSLVCKNDTLYGSVTLNEGENNIIVCVFDRSGYMTDTTISLYVDLYPPQISVYPYSGGIVNDTNVSMRVSISNAKYFDSGIESLYCVIDDSLYFPNDTIEGNFVFYLNNIIEGWHSREIICKDKAGYRDVLIDSFGVDITPPEGIRISMERDTVYSSSYVLIWTKGEDNMSGISMYVVEDSLHNHIYTGLDTFCTINGTYGKLYLYAYDNVGNSRLCDSIFVYKENGVIVYPSPININTNSNLVFEGVENGDILVIMTAYNKVLKIVNVVNNTSGKVILSSEIFSKGGLYYWYIKKSDGKIIKGKLGVIR